MSSDLNSSVVTDEHLLLGQVPHRVSCLLFLSWSMHVSPGQRTLLTVPDTA